MAKQSVDALSLKDLQLGLENGQFTAKKHKVFFISLRHFSYRVDGKMLNEFCILTIQIKITHRLYNFCTTYRPKNYFKKCCDTFILCCYLSLLFSSGNLNVKFWKQHTFSRNGRVRKNIIPSGQHVNKG